MLVTAAIVGGVLRIKFSIDEAVFVGTMAGVFFAGSSVFISILDNENRSLHELKSSLIESQVQIQTLRLRSDAQDKEISNLVQRVGLITGRMDFTLNFNQVRDNVEDLHLEVERLKHLLELNAATTPAPTPTIVIQ